MKKTFKAKEKFIELKSQHEKEIMNREKKMSDAEKRTRDKESKVSSELAKTKQLEQKLSNKINDLDSKRESILKKQAEVEKNARVSGKTT